MSVDIDWAALTGGQDGAALAEKIRDFIHERFQHVTLPRLIRSVKCHTFDFGTVAPQIVLKDICDPLPDFYETDEGDDQASNDGIDVQQTRGEKATESLVEEGQGVQGDGHVHQISGMSIHGRSNSPNIPRGATPGILGGTSNLGYFHLPLSAGFSGPTPLAAVAGAHFHTNSQDTAHSGHFRSNSSSSISPPSSNAPSRPTSRDTSNYFDRRHESTISEGHGTEKLSKDKAHETSPDDLQVVFHVSYVGDVKLSLTAEVFLDYPMPSFVGIPLKLNITGMTFDGVGVLAYIKKRAHLCFLSPEDAEALIGSADIFDSPDPVKNVHESYPKGRALLEEIRIESEMGETDSGKQVLKNVGKIEKFVLEQVRRIFEEEFVYPSFWTFLV
ncbi:hypothetical protein M433DRAFT_65062 [Acidomyces richmondensis BFW]|nr:MAG: hypothetical protein FE78DRAFT_28294 [Acidomyces sp. 'richmondensis']KYG46474.1 hypothetical protein M433DRAFT_65062 [Acidomyces richmondensis BFW]